MRFGARIRDRMRALFLWAVTDPPTSSPNTLCQLLTAPDLLGVRNCSSVEQVMTTVDISSAEPRTTGVKPLTFLVTFFGTLHAVLSLPMLCVKQRAKLLAAGLLVVVLGLSACDRGGAHVVDDASEDLVVLQLSEEDGLLVFCAEGLETGVATNDGCYAYPNPDRCARLEVSVDLNSGQTCETCFDSEGQTLRRTCEASPFACTKITAPEPDCLVCAHENGVVLFSSCSAQENCFAEYTADGAECIRCYDGSGRATLDGCGDGDRCDNIACTASCGPGFELYSPVGTDGLRECCPICVPKPANCDRRICAQDTEIPSCPEGYDLLRDPQDCCYYHCEPTECPAALVDRLIDCGKGFEWRVEAPECGRCLPLEPEEPWPLECTSDPECASSGLVCSTSSGDCRHECVRDASGQDRCSDVCMGTCVQPEPDCATLSTEIGSRCDGRWEVDGFDPVTGCAELPVCMCANGNISLDGSCAPTTCEQMSCFGPPPVCEATEILNTDFPYCCGICAEKACSATVSPICPQLNCLAGSHRAPGPDCCDVCVLDLNSDCEEDSQCIARGAVCVAGQCFAEAPCIDVDAGVTPETPGQIRVQQGDTTIVLEDYCLDPRVLLEYYCTSAFPDGPPTEESAVRITCENGCKAGACTAGLTPGGLPHGDGL